MPNLVGIGLSQVPTNSMLGGMAYQDPEHASIKDLDLKNLSQINSEIADTALQMFLYDTSKDSDGGAWRKRTQQTSWYNETLNTATRGSRREFPAVAVLVTETNKLTIYDGDDPDLPMWMVFNQVPSGSSTASHLANTITSSSSIFMLNGILCVGFPNNGWGISQIGFVSDSQEFRWSGGIYRLPTADNIAKRNVASSWKAYDITTTDIGLGNANINDISMIALPSARIDNATGLPVPTIATATAGGVRIIQDSGIVVAKTTTGGATHQVDWMSATRLLTTAPLYYGIFDDPFVAESDAYISNIANSSYYAGSGDGSSYNYPRPIADLSATSQLIATDSRTIIAATNSGLNIHELSTGSGTDNNDGIVAHATTFYNTGWMQGNIKGAYLSDTDTTNVSDTQVLTNHDFANGITGWTINLNGASGGSPGITVSSNKLVFQQGTSNSVWLEAYQVITTVIGQRYSVTINVASTNTGANWRVYADGVKILGYPSGLSQGSHTAQFVATSTTASIQVQQGGSANTSGEINSVSVIRMEEDRSAANLPLTVTGTITKSAVATGADLVAYSGFSNSTNYMNSNSYSVNFGNPPTISIMFWQKITDITDYSYAVSFSHGNTIKGGISNGADSTDYAGEAYFYMGSTTLYSEARVDDGKWHCIVGTISGTAKKFYLDGNLVSSTTIDSYDMSGISKIHVGSYGVTHVYAHKGSIALLRVSNSVPSAEQVKKMYEDEKHLFQENVACTLYGSSDAVKALAYDEVTDHLHVGTSSGRSDFQGLRRINNTTVGITSAISAHDEFIIEQ